MSHTDPRAVAPLTASRATLQEQLRALPLWSRWAIRNLVLMARTKRARTTESAPGTAIGDVAATRHALLASEAWTDPNAEPQFSKGTCTLVGVALGLALGARLWRGRR